MAFGILLAVLVLCLSACGKRKARVEPPSRPSDEVEPSQSPASHASVEALKKTTPPPDISETLNSPENRLNSAKGTPLGPTIRIGLTTDAQEILISSSGDYYLKENLPETSRQLVRGKIRIRVEQEGERTGTISCYRVQVSSLRSRPAAENLQRDLSEKHNVPVIIQGNEDATSNRIRVGEYPTRAEAEKMLDTLKHSGHPDAFIVEDVRSSRSGKSVLALRGDNDLFYLNRSGFLFIPPSDAVFLTVNGKPYRGLLDIQLNESSRITVVNHVRVEEYLLGVVPAELSPSRYPEFDALAAQSIVARTYALKHMGQYNSEGFDLTDDTRTQVYEGMTAEQNASNEAVRLTAGLAVYYDDKLIDAMYMSTCGGRTEESSSVYDTQPVPYLRSVICAVEDGLDDSGTIIKGNHRLDAPVLTDDGIVANRNLEFARILGIIQPNLSFSPEYLSGAITGDEATHLIKNTLKILNADRKVSNASSIDTRAGFLKSAAESIFGSDEIQRRISERDAAYYIGNLDDGDALPESARTALAYLIQKGLWHPFSDNTAQPNDPIRRSEAIYLLLRWTESVKPDILRYGVFAGQDSALNDGSPASEIQIKWGNSVQKFPLSDTLPTFRRDSGRIIPVNRIRIIGNEKTFFHLGPDKSIDFLEVELNSTGAASDRYSPVATWEVTFSQSDVAEKLRGLAGNIGEFRDLEPARLGKSGRAVQIRVIGSRTSVVLNGYRVRGALGLRDTLFTLTREHNPDGSVAKFMFHGRGFGHGIGLCQTGAFGMAKAGKSYEEILKTYYTGVEIQKAY